jgi:hypothetical protein
MLAAALALLSGGMAIAQLPMDSMGWLTGFLQRASAQRCDTTLRVTSDPVYNRKIPPRTKAAYYLERKLEQEQSRRNVLRSTVRSVFAAAACTSCDLRLFEIIAFVDSTDSLVVSGRCGTLCCVWATTLTGLQLN